MELTEEISKAEALPSCPLLVVNRRLHEAVKPAQGVPHRVVLVSNSAMAAEEGHQTTDDEEAAEGTT